MSESSEILKKVDEHKARAIGCLPEIEDLDVTCKALLNRYFTDIKSVDSAAMFKIQAIIDYMYEQVHVGNWREVPTYIRKTITIASYVKLLGHVKSTNDFTEEAIREAFKIIDYGLIFGCPLDDEPILLHKCCRILDPLRDRVYQNLNFTLDENAAAVKAVESSSSYQEIEVINYADLSMERFFTHVIQGNKPVVIDKALIHWPAFHKWKDLNYLIKLAGMRTVSVELGSNYTEKDWTQKLMTIEDFIMNHICQNEVPGYLAQYQIFQQIPELKEDIIIPDYCSYCEQPLSDADIMVWFGPRGTVSPMHHDAKKNLLSQVVGSKRLFLYSPEDTENVYPHEHELLQNTAQVDPTNLDLEKFPKYKNAKPYHCVLTAGQMLYIPPKWWHYVESLSISFSVSFWWE